MKLLKSIITSIFLSVFIIGSVFAGDFYTLKKGSAKVVENKDGTYGVQTTRIHKETGEEESSTAGRHKTKKEAQEIADSLNEGKPLP